MVSKSSLRGLDSKFIGPPTFIGGRNVDWSQDMASSRKEGGVLPSQCIELENFNIDEQGILTSREGTDKINSTAINSGGQIHSMHRYYKASTQAKYFMLQTGTKVGTVALGTGAFSEKATGLAATPLKWITWNDNCYAFNGTGIYKFDGTTWSQIQDSDADCPDSVDGVVLNDVLFTARDGATYPSRVPYSKEFDAEDWTATDFRRINERDGHIIISLLRSGSKILCLKDLSAWWLYGSSIYSFREEKLSDDLGQIGRQASVSFEDKAFFQSNRGIEYFDPSTPRMFNNIARGTCADELTSLSRTVREAAVMIYWPKKHRLLVSYPTAGTPIIYVFYLQHPRVDEDGNIWFPHSTYTGITVTAMVVLDATGDAGELYWGTDDGYIYQFDSGWSDDGTAIDWRFKWGFTDCGLPIHVKNFSRVYLPARTVGTLDITLNMDFSKKTQSKTTTTYLPTEVGIWDAGKWDEAKFGEAYVLTRHTRYNKMNGIKAAIIVSGNSIAKVEIHPFKIEYVPKERVRFP